MLPTGSVPEPTLFPGGEPLTGSLITHGPRDRPRIALTFDADMTRAVYAALRTGRARTWYDPSIVDELRATHTPATIFLTGL